MQTQRNRARESLIGLLQAESMVKRSRIDHAEVESDTGNIMGIIRTRDMNDMTLYRIAVRIIKGKY